MHCLSLTADEQQDQKDNNDRVLATDSRGERVSLTVETNGRAGSTLLTDFTCSRWNNKQ